MMIYVIILMFQNKRLLYLLSDVRNDSGKLLRRRPLYVKLLVINNLYLARRQITKIWWKMIKLIIVSRCVPRLEH